MGTSQSKTEPSILPVRLPVMADSSLSYLLIGKAGNGKSSSGNTLVGKPVFKSFDKTTAGTKHDWFYETKRLGKHLRVFDTPGLKDTDDINRNIEHARFARKYLTKAFQVCPEGFDALLIVLNVTNKYSSEEKNVIELLTEIFGNFMFDYTILIFTRGDNFDSEHQISDADRSQVFFKSWCKQQAGDLGELLKKCQYRAVLFHNTDTYRLQRDVELLALDSEVKKILNKGCRYTEKSFQRNEHRRKHLIINKYLLELEKEINGKLLTLKKELLLIESDGETITDKAQEVSEAIDKHGCNFPDLNALKKSVENLQNNFKLQTSYQEKLHLISETQELIDCKVLSELRSLSNFIDDIRNPEKHQEDLKMKATQLARYIEEEDLGTNKLNDLKSKLDLLLLQINDLDTKGCGRLAEIK